MSDLIKQLRVNSGWRDRNWQCITDPARLLEAANEIERLTAEVRRLDYSTIHTCWDECPRVVCAQRRKIEALTAQLAEAQQQASKLWALLDDIDTLDDSCRGDDDLFRTLTRAAQLTRHAIMTGEEWDAARADPVRDTLADSDGDDGA